MGNVHTFTSHIKTDVAAVQATRNNNANTPTYFSMANYDLAAFIVFTGARTGSASLTAQIRQRIGAAGTEADVTGAVSTITTADGLTVIQVRGEDLNVTGGYTHVGILLTETASQAFVVGAICARDRARYKSASLPA